MIESKSSEFILLLSLYAFVGILWIDYGYNIIWILLPLTFYIILELINKVKGLKKNE